MRKRMAVLILFSAALSAQTITWTKQTGGTNPPWGAQWIQLVPNPVSHNTLMFGDDNGQGSDIFMNSLYGMTITNPTSATGLVVQKLGTSGTHTNGCPFARADWPGDNQFNKGVWWDSLRNKMLTAFGVCNLGHPNAADRSPAMWQYVPSSTAPPMTLGEKWSRINPTSAVATAMQPWLSIIHDPVDDLYFAYGFETSAAPPKLFCSTDRNTTPGTLSTAQTTAGCTVPDGWTEPASSTYLCKATPSSTAVACSNSTIPPINALPYLAWDTATSKIVMFGEGSAITNLGTAQTWIYDPPTKTFTNVSSDSTPPPVWLTNGDQIPPMAFNPNDGFYYFHQKAGYTISVATAGSGYTPGTHAVLWTGSCTNKAAATYTVDGTGTVVSVSPTWTSLPSTNCVGVQTPSATQSGGGGSGATFNFTWNAQADWTLISGTWVWTNLGTFTGPPTAQSMEIDPAWNTIIVWAYTSAGAAEMWLGQISGTYVPTITTVGLPGATNAVAYSQQLTAGTTNGAVTWTSSGLPGWASLSSGGLLTGTPNAVGTTTFTATATNTSGATSKSLSIIVAPATLSIPLTIQEALYPGGTTGVARTNESFCMGVPIPDSAQLDAGEWNALGLSGSDAGLTTLGLTGATAGQFRVLAVWPDGYAKWIETCGILSSLSAGSTATVTLTNSGSGNFGGSNLATTTDASNTIVVNTGTGTCGTSSANCFTLKKLNHDGIDEVQLGTTIVLNTGSGELGYTINGPDPSATYPNNATCVSGTSCQGSFMYSTSADAQSYCKVEKNGPVQSVIYCATTHRNGVRPYMRTITRYYFNQGSTAVRATVTLANEDTVETDSTGADLAAYGASLTGTFATAWKNLQAYELRLKPNITGTLTFQFGTNVADACSGLCTGTLNQAGGTDFAYIYQGQSTSMQSTSGPSACGTGCVQPTTDTGYKVVNDSTTMVSPTATTVYPQGWADIANSSGVGVEIGLYQLAANYPASLEFQAGGADVRIGLFSSYNSQTAYIPWPNQITRDIWMKFHASAPASLANEFLKFQHPLVGHAAYTWYNSAGVFPYQLSSSATEDAYYNATQAASITPTPAGSTTISSVTTTNPVQITLASSIFASGLSKFQEVLISPGSSGCAALNGAFNIWAISGTTLTIQNNMSQMDTSGCGSFTAGQATIQALSAIGSSAACCIADLGTSSTTWPILLYHSWAWSSTGGANQDEFRFSNLMAFITRGMTGRYLDAWHWYRYAGDLAWPRSLGFDWRGTPSTSTYLDSYGFPSHYTQANTGTATQIWINSDSGEHSHWYDMPYAYLMTGDETIKDALLDGPKDYFLQTTNNTWNPTGTYQTGNSGGNGLYNARAIGANLAGAAEFSAFLSSINDPDSTGVQNLGIADYTNQVKPQLCANGYPGACTLSPAIDLYPTAPSSAAWTTTGVNPVRGVFESKNQSTASSTWCGVNHTLRGNETFMSAILVKGMLRLRAVAGSGWSEYWNSLDLADGIARQNMTEMYYDDSSGRWDVTGFRYMQATDWANNCTGTSEYPRPEFAPQNINAAAPLFLARSLAEGGTAWQYQFKNYLQRNMAADGFSNSSPAADLETILPQSVISIVNSTISTLQPVTCSTFTDNGGGSYTLSGCPGNAAAAYYRVKYSTAHPLVDWIGYDAGTASFTGSPSTTSPWFSAANATGIPAPSGSPWSITVNTGQTGLTASNFSVKAMEAGGGGGTLTMPTFAPVTGTYGGAQSVTISGPSGATICYNTTGPTATVAGTCDAGSTTYSGAVNVPSSETLYAIATEAGYGNSSVGSAAYSIGLAAGGSFFSGTLRGNSVIH